MLDSHIVNIRNEVDNWLLSFNEAISDKNNKKDSIENLNKLFFEDCHWFSKAKISIGHTLLTYETCWQIYYKRDRKSSLIRYNIELIYYFIGFCFWL